MRTEIDQLLYDGKHQNTEVTPRIEKDDTFYAVRLTRTGHARIRTKTRTKPTRTRTRTRT